MTIIVLYSRHFERMLIQTGRELNVMVNQMDPVFNMGLPRNAPTDAIEKDVQKFLNQTKQLVPPIELVVVVIPDYPPRIYGK